MRRWLVAASFALVAAISVASALAQTDQVTAEPGALEGTVEQIYPGSQLIAVKVDKVFGASRAPDAKTDPPPPPDVKGRTVYVHVAADTKILDKGGRDLTATRAKGGPLPDDVWTALREGGRCRIEFTGRHQIAAPDTVPEQDRIGAMVLVFKTSMLRLLGDV
jgi:hypothetical protein